MRTVLARIRSHFSDRAHSARLDEEISSHLEALAAHHQSRGLTPADARLAARREFGALAQLREQHRELRRLPFFDTLAQDLGYAARQMAAHPVFTAAAILTLALGMGANTAIFRVLDAVVLSPLPVPQANQLIEAQLFTDGRDFALAYPQYVAIAAHARTFSHLAAAFNLAPASGSPDPLQTRLVSGAYFPALGVPARLGRTFGPTDDRPDQPAIAVISDAYFRRALGSDTAALGRSLRVNGLSATVIGVMPRGFFGEEIGSAPDVWLPISFAPRMSETQILLNPRIASLSPFGRLAPGVSVAQASAELAALYAQYKSLGATIRNGRQSRFELTPVGHGVGIFRHQFSASLSALMAISALVLLIACCNLANLLLARSVSRTHEVGVRLALGAGRARILRQFLTESLALAVLGAALGFVLAQWASHALVEIASAGRGWRLSLDPDFRIFAFTSAIGLLSVAIFGIAPAFAALRVDIQAALQASRRTAAGGRRGSATSRIFVAAQVAVGVLLLSTAALLVHSFRNLQTQELGLNAHDLLIVRFNGFSPVNTSEQFARIDQAMNAIPGVTAAGVASADLFGGMTEVTKVMRPDDPTGRVDTLSHAAVSPRYFDALGIAVLAGRGIDATDLPNSPPVVVLTQTAAHQLFGSENPIGRPISFEEARARPLGAPFVLRFAAPREVVGVVRDLRSGPRASLSSLAFLPYTQTRVTLTSIALRTLGDPRRFAKAATQVLASTAPRIQPSVIHAAAFDDLLAAMTSQERLVALLAAVFGFLALALTSLGLYGVIAHAVQARTREIGLRIALGARRTQVTSLLLADLAATLAIGLAFGLAGTLVTGRWIQSLLFNLTVHDKVTLAGAAMLLAAAGLLAGYLPARRAARLDPMQALREE